MAINLTEFQIKPGGSTPGGDYTLLSQWEVAECGDPVANQVSPVAVVWAGDYVGATGTDGPNTAMDDAVVLEGGPTTVSEDYHPIVRCRVGDEHGGVFGEGPMVTKSSSGAIIGLRIAYVDIEGIQLVGVGTSNIVDHSSPGAANTFTNCLFDIQDGARAYFCGFTVVVDLVRFANCVFDASTGAGRGLYPRGENPTEVVYCTFVSSSGSGSYALSGYAGTGAVATNTVIIGYDDSVSGSRFTLSTYLATDDLNGTITGVTADDFVDYTNGDYTPAVGGKLENAGVAIAGITTDITGFARGNPPEIGAYEIPAAEPNIKTLKSTGGDHSLMSEWEAALPATLSAPEILECYKGTTTDGNWNADGSLTDSVTIDGHATTATNTITIRAAIGDEAHFIGYEAVDGFRLSGDVNAALIGIDNPFVTVKGVGLYNANSLAFSRSIKYPVSGKEGVIVDSCIILKGNVREALEVTSPLSTDTYKNRVINTVVVNLSTNTGTTGSLYFCNVLAGSNDLLELVYCNGVQNKAGFASNVFQNTSLARDMIAINCVAAGASSTDAFNAGFDNAASDYNAGFDASAPGANSVDNIISADFVDYDNSDYTPSANSQLKDAGVTIAGIDYDITGFLRESPPEIGAYEIQGGAVKIENMHVKDSDVFVKAAPHVRDGGAWVAVDAYVRDGGVWVQVHEK